MQAEKSDTSTLLYRASSGNSQGIGPSPGDALSELMRKIDSTPTDPIIIWPYKRGDKFFTDSQQQRLEHLKSNRQNLTSDEIAELENLVRASFEATIARSHSLKTN
jgi:hypothetical protein